MPSAARPALEALWRLDATLGAVLATGRDKMVSRIRLAWWREALERLDDALPPPEPVLQALSAHVLPRGVTGAELAAMEQGWAELLAEGALDAAALDAYAAARGAGLFRLSARLLGAGEDRAAEAGARWALVDLARRSADPAEAGAVLAAARRLEAPRSWPRPLRPLGMLSILSRRDIERGPRFREMPGSPARMARIFYHRLTGR